MYTGLCACGKRDIALNSSVCDICAVFADPSYDVPKRHATEQEQLDYELNYPIEQQWRDKAMTAIEKISAKYPPRKF